MREAAHFISGQSASAPAGALQWLVSAARSAYCGYRQRRQMISLSEADDHLLADIGVTREDVLWALDLPLSRNSGFELQRRALRNGRRGRRG